MNLANCAIFPNFAKELILYIEYVHMWTNLYIDALRTITPKPTS